MYFADENLLYNPRLRRAYRIKGGVPVMLADRAEPVPEPEHERLLTRVRDGDAVLSAVAPECSLVFTLIRALAGFPFHDCGPGSGLVARGHGAFAFWSYLRSPGARWRGYPGRRPPRCRGEC